VTLAITLRTSLIVLNVLVLVGAGVFLSWRYFSLRRNPEPHEPQNLEEFFDDDVLEGRKLERVLGWSLVMTVIIAISLPLYFLIEPDRQETADETYLDDSIERGATLFANEQSPDYDPAFSLQCANCHGLDAKGGAAPAVIEPEDPTCVDDQDAEERPECRPVPVDWRAPALDTAVLTYGFEEGGELDLDQLTEIITYGRPGTPMPAWGVESGEGVLNEQGIEDLVNYIQSIQITPEEAMRRTQEEYEAVFTTAEDAVDERTQELEAAEQELANAAPAERAAAQENVDDAAAALAVAVDYRAEVESASEGEILFWNNCARCHTKGWSYYDPLEPDAAPPPGPMGGGAYGPNLRDGAELRQFPGAEGPQLQYDFVANGAKRNEAYGVRGISSGRMPHFASVLTKQQIKAIIRYERSL
jgi:mono/diheme cytochrome c family protein